MNPKEGKVIDRRQFIQQLMRQCGFTFAEATKAFDCMCRVFENSVVSGSRINIGRVGALVPVWKPGRDILMHFSVGKGRKIKTGTTRTYHKDGHYEFKFRLYDKFIQTRNLQWFLEFPEA